MNTRNRNEPAYLNLLARHFSLWLQMGTVEIGEGTNQASAAYRAMEGKAKNAMSAVALGAMVYELRTVTTDALGGLLRDYLFGRLVVSPAKLRSLYRLRKAITGVQVLEALREGYPHLVPSEDAPVKRYDLVGFLDHPAGKAGKLMAHMV